MLNNLKKTQKNHVFLDDDDDMDVDNMDFPLPSEPSSSSSSSARRAPSGGVPSMGGGMPDLSSMMSAMGGMGGMGGGGMPDMAQLQQMMQSMGGGLGGGAQRPGASMAAPPAKESVVTVASGPNGVSRQMRPEEFKE